MEVEIDESKKKNLVSYELLWIYDLQDIQITMAPSICPV